MTDETPGYFTYDLMLVPSFRNWQHTMHDALLFTMKRKDSRYILLHYNKNLIHDANTPAATGWMRSVVLGPNKEVVCFAPPRSDQYLTVLSDPQHSETPMCYKEDLIEGAMVNMFWDRFANQWEIATRRNIGGYSRYNTKTPFFRDLFFQTIHTHATFDQFNKRCCYSFVLKHPRFHLVHQSNTPQLFLVRAYEIVDTHKVREIPVPSFFPHHARPVLLHNRQEVEAMCQRYQHTAVTHLEMGIVIHCPSTGRRLRIRNPAYNYVRQMLGIRGVNPHEHFLQLYRSNLLTAYLHFFPRDQRFYQLMHLRYQEMMQQIWQFFFAHVHQGITIPPYLMIHIQRLLKMLHPNMSQEMAIFVIDHYLQTLTPRVLSNLLQKYRTLA